MSESIEVVPVAGRIGAEIRGVRLEATEESVKRTSVVREPDGSLHPATLIEFY